MNEYPYRAKIPALPEGTDKPVWSVMIPTFNCAQHLGQTLRSVLDQDLGPDVMQIEVVDDGSNEDDPEEVVRDIGRGRVSFFRQPTNVGITRNFETCLRRSRGVLVHQLHGDDLVHEGFYKSMRHGFTVRPAIGAAFCRHAFIDDAGRQIAVSDLEQPESGLLPNALVRLASEQRVMTPSIVVRRSVYEDLGGFDSRLRCAEDWEMWVRIAARYPIWYEPAILCSYRMHTHSNTGRHVNTGEDMRYSRMAIEIFREYLPGSQAGAIARRAKQTYAQSALGNAYSMLMEGKLSAAAAQTTEALRFSASFSVFAQLARLLLKAGANVMMRSYSR